MTAITEFASCDHPSLAKRASRPLSSSPRPFIRWAGSKRSLLHEIVPVLPTRYRTYHEPFLGSAALFFLLQPQRANLSDSCGELIETYKAVRDNPGVILKYIDPWYPDRSLYDLIRKNRSRGRLKRAAEFIYLNKMCWNGLYRVNSEGVFNVPFGRPKTGNIVDAQNVHTCSRLLRSSQVLLKHADFEEALQPVDSGDLVFLDPPYVTGHNNNGFIDYNRVLFSWPDQERLARLALALADRGAHVIVMNAAHDDVLGLYEGFRWSLIERSSTIAGAASKRRRVTEALLWHRGLDG